MLTAIAVGAKIRSMHRERAPAFRQATTAFVAALALVVQALLATWPPPAETGRPLDHQAGVPGHPAEHHAHQSGADPADPPRHDGGQPPAADHHRACCILGGKLGTALGPAPAAVPLPSREAQPAAAERAPVKIIIVARAPLRPLGARAPPVTG